MPDRRQTPDKTRARNVRRPLSESAIVTEAVAIVRSASLAQLSMRTLGQRLEATPMAIYKHVAGREELERLVVERCFDELLLPPMELDPLVFLTRLAHAVRALGLRYPGIMAYLLAHGPVVRGALIVLDRTVLRLHAAGLSFQEAGELHNTFFSWLAGAVRRQQTGAADASARFDAFYRAAESLPSADYPGLAQAIVHMKKSDYESEFATSLGVLLDAVAVRIARAQGLR